MTANLGLIILDHDVVAEEAIVRLDSFKIQHPEYGGSQSEPVGRVNVHRGDAVAGLLHAEKDGEHRILLVEQFRFSTVFDPDTGMPDIMGKRPAPGGDGFLVELMAGMRKKGEPWANVLERECREETGHGIEADPTFIGSYYPSPGACSEQIHLFYARLVIGADDPLPETRPLEAKGLGDSTEDIRLISLRPAEFMEWIETNQLTDGKCYVAAEWMRRPGNFERFGL